MAVFHRILAVYKSASVLSLRNANLRNGSGTHLIFFRRHSSQALVTLLRFWGGVTRGGCAPGAKAGDDCHCPDCPGFRSSSIQDSGDEGFVAVEGAIGTDIIC
jgi:hypothetical protein